MTLKNLEHNYCTMRNQYHRQYQKGMVRTCYRRLLVMILLFWLILFMFISKHPWNMRFEISSHYKNHHFLEKFNTNYQNRANDVGTLLNRNNCRPETKVAFLKTHRSGSSTIQNILFRFGVRKNLTFAIPNKGWMFNMERPLNAKSILKGPFGELAPFDIVASHCRWDTEEVLKLVPKAKIITIIRDPVRTFASVYALSDMKESIDDYVKRLATADYAQVPPGSLLGKNNLLWEFGLNTDNENTSAKLFDVDDKFDLVMITERFEESVILLADKMCWPLEDVTYLIHNARNSDYKIKVKDLTATMLRKKVLAGDYKLYMQFVGKFERLVDAFGKKRMSQAVTKLKDLNKRVKEECFGSEEARLTVWNGPLYEFVLKDAGKKPFWCTPHVWNETIFTKAIRQHQQKRVEAFQNRNNKTTTEINELTEVN